MAVRYILGLCAALLSVSALAADSVSAGVDSGAKRFRVINSTMTHPVNTTLSASNAPTSYIQKRSTALAQSALGNLSIATKDGVRVNANVTGEFRVPNAALKSSAQSLTRTLGALGYAYMAVEGLELLANQMGWYMDYHNMLLYKVTDITSWTPDSLVPGNCSNSGDPYCYETSAYSSSLDNSYLSDLCTFNGTTSCQVIVPAGQNIASYQQAARADALAKINSGNEVAACSSLPIAGYPIDAQSCVVFVSGINYNPQPDRDMICERTEGCTVSAFWAVTHVTASHVQEYDWETDRYVDYSPYFGQSNRFVYEPTDKGGVEPVTYAESDQAIEQFYDPQPSDWEELFEMPEFQPESFHVDPIPDLTIEGDVTTTTDPLTGSTVAVSGNTKLEFNVAHNASAQPEISIRESHAVQEYTDGVLTNSSTTVTDRPALPSVNQPPEPAPGTGTNPGGSPIPGELPFFCEYAAFLCDWLDWTRSDDGLPPVDPDEDIFAGIDLNEYDISEFETIDMSFGGGASCPEPIQINVTFLNRTVEITYDAWCSLADTARLLVLAVAWMSAVSIIIGGIRRS